MNGLTIGVAFTSVILGASGSVVSGIATFFCKIIVG